MSQPVSPCVSRFVGLPARLDGRRTAAALLAGLTVALAGRGSNSRTKERPLPTPPSPTGEAAKPAATIIADARKELLAARSVHVASTGPARLLRLQRPAGRTGLAGTLDFSEHGEALTVKPPARATELAKVRG